MRGATGVPQRVLIVGGSSEIGAALGRLWLKRGTRSFVLTERESGRASQLTAELTAAGAAVTVEELDAGRPETMRPAIEAAWLDGDIDVVVVAIGVLPDQLEVESDPSLSWRVLTVNATASIQIGLLAAQRLHSQQHGTLVLLSSVAGQRGRRDNYVYGASKAAVDTFAEGLQQRFAGTEIDVLVVRPGYVYSKMSAGIEPAPFAVTVSHSADQIVRAVDRRRATVWVPPVLAVFFALFRLLPRRVWATIVRRTR